MQENKKYYINFVCVCIGGFLMAYGLNQLQSRFFTNEHYWFPTLFFALTTLATNALLTKGEKESKEFIFKALAMSMARLLVCMIVVFIYSYINKPQVLGFTCQFMVQYFIFTVFEIAFLLKYIKQTS